MINQGVVGYISWWAMLVVIKTAHMRCGMVACYNQSCVHNTVV